MHVFDANTSTEDTTGKHRKSKYDSTEFQRLYRDVTGCQLWHAMAIMVPGMVVRRYRRYGRSYLLVFPIGVRIPLLPLVGI